MYLENIYFSTFVKERPWINFKQLLDFFLKSNFNFSNSQILFIFLATAGGNRYEVQTIFLILLSTFALLV